MVYTNSAVVADSSQTALQHVTDMSGKEKASWRRRVGSTMLMAWCSALFFCSAHCLFGVGECGAESKASSCHAATAQGGKSSAPESQGRLFCHGFEQAIRFRSVLPTLEGQPMPGAVSELLEGALLADLSETSHKVLFLRQKTSPRVCTPEVYLGPAFRTLAPP